jgi:ribonuclease HII
VAASAPGPDLESRLVFEKRAQNQGWLRVAGVDEAGRGPLAGPVVAACVILREDISGLEEVTDSKKLTSSKRSHLYDAIRRKTADVGIGIVDHQTIDRINILQATFLAMERAVAQLAPPPDFLLIDGNQRPPWAKACETIISGDALSLSISAASIIAKVTRDRIMEEADLRFPQWGFAQHKGYGTAGHMEAIRQFGACEIHRKSFFPISQLALGIIPARKIAP